MPATYEPIASTTLGSAAADITFSSIPGTFTDLVLVFNGKGNTTNERAHGLRVNSDTGTNYSVTVLGAYPTSNVQSARQSSATYMYAYDMSTSTEDPCIAVFHLMSYANTNVFKTILAATTGHTRTVARAVGLWRSTSAITSVTLVRSDGSNYAAGATAALYGIKAA